jgi:imidazolonepropionase-like amidohydrolase/Tol biopolymer transport system component
VPALAVSFATLLACALTLALAASLPAFAHDGDDHSVSLSPSTVGLALATADTGQSKPPASGGGDSKWDVNNPPGEKRTVNLDVQNGTWMSVDVSPDGKDIVFDLMGDLYTIPITGGEAKALTSGMAWDEQPRYSPDGGRIAFTSDRAGGDNIWVINRDGAKPRQVTKESYRLLNSPTWTPDGQYIAARKHFTSTRSAGAGEIWLYHWTGGEGVQMTKRRTDQKDEGEPAFSPDGKYLYWSMDATPGRSFEYNKDSNTGIYAIQRLNRETGEITTFAGGPGGAIRPTPSPDGRSVAFIRRVRFQSVLYVADVASGIERPVYDAMERDMQEIWAVHGVYPGFAWTPDSKALVFWAKGTLHRLDVKTLAVSDIPFHVKDTRQVLDAVRFATPVAPESSRTRMLRWVSVSPKGDAVVYSALGRLWIKPLPDGRPRRLTPQNDHFEYYPSWSRDGRSIVYVSWDDRKLGAVRVVPAGGGTGRMVTRDPGHYVEPVFSPDGATIVYRADNGGYLTSSQWGRETGIYRVPAAGGESRLITRRGYLPGFGAANDRVYLSDAGGADGDERVLFSVDLGGAQERTHLKGVYFTEARISPDEKWVAFREKYKVFVMPFIRTGSPVDIGPGARNLPVRLVANDSGEYLNWAGDSRGLHWALGSTLFTRDLRELFTFVPGAPDSLPGDPPRRREIGFAYALDKPTGVIALTGARVVTMKGDEVIENGTVVIRDNRIAAVGPSGQVTVPAGAKVFDVSGRTITPGLVDAHWHGSMGNDQIVPQTSWINYASLAFGVTTLHDPSNNSGAIFTSGELQRAGMIVAPRIFSTGTILYGAKGDFRADVDSLGDALVHLRRMQALGASSVKSYNQPRREQRQQVLEAARRLQMNVVPEGGALYPHNMTMVIDGHTGIEHALPVERVYDDVVQLWSQTRVGYTPTFGVAYGGLDGEHYWYAKTNVWEDPRLLAFVPRRIVDARARRPQAAPDNEWNVIPVAQEANKLYKAGVGVQIGAHGQREGLAAHWEMWTLVMGGMSPHEALRCATLGGARYLGYDREVGSLEPGKLADLVVMDANPLENIRNTNTVSMVMVNGRLYDGPTMNEIAPRLKAREPFWWEEGERQLEALRR